MEILGVAWENILVGLISAGLIGIAAYLKKKIENFRIERKFPIAGEYLSKFEDEIDGKNVIVSAPVILKQKGKKIIGETALPDDDRSWILEGEISSGGHIHGVYYAEDPHDKGIGNFFLYINYKKYMEGLWSGFDSINQKITSGRYSFAPVISNLKIENASSSDLPSIIEISDKELGKDYLDERIKQTLNNETTVFRIAKTPKDGILGFCYSYFASPEQIQKDLNLKKLPKPVLYSSNVGVLKTVAIKSDFKGRGVGTALIDDSLQIFRKNNIQTVISVAWKSKKGINIEGVMNHYKFNFQEEILDFWKNDSIEKNYECPECGNPCSCSAIIYTKAL